MAEKPTSPLQPLRIPTGWAIEWNTFLEVDPTFEMGDMGSIGFGEDLLHAVNKHTAVLLDLGWYPAGDPEGEYRLVAVRTHADGDEMRASWGRPLRVLSSRSRAEIAQSVEDWLWHFAHHAR